MLRWKSKTQRYGSHIWAALWKLQNDCLPMIRELANRNLFIDASCPSCAIEKECLDYVFITYNLTCVMWFRSPLTIRRYLSQSQVIIVLPLGWKV